jgi:hypothetical protein
MTAAPKRTVDAAQRDCFFTLRSRAYELADTGRYKEWSQVAYALLAEGFVASVIRRLDRDGLAVMLVTRSCRRAVAEIPASPSRTRRWLGHMLSRLW